MRVAYVSFHFGEICIRLANAMSEIADTTVCLFLPHDVAEPHRHLLSSNVGLQLFKRAKLRQVFKQIQTVARLIKDIKDFKPDVVHVECGELWFNLALPLLGDSS